MHSLSIPGLLAGHGRAQQPKKRGENDVVLPHAERSADHVLAQAHPLAAGLGRERRGQRLAGITGSRMAAANSRSLLP